MKQLFIFLIFITIFLVHKSNGSPMFEDCSCINLSCSQLSEEGRSWAESLINRTRTFVLEEFPNLTYTNVMMKNRGYYLNSPDVNGFNHYNNPDFFFDNLIFDETKPEVYFTDEYNNILGVVYTLLPNTTMTDVPTIADPIMKFHSHDDRCFSLPCLDHNIPKSNSPCPQNYIGLSPMVHVWMNDPECGPFSSIDCDCVHHS